VNYFNKGVVYGFRPRWLIGFSFKPKNSFVAPVRINTLNQRCFFFSDAYQVIKAEHVYFLNIIASVTSQYVRILNRNNLAAVIFLSSCLFGQNVQGVIDGYLNLPKNIFFKTSNVHHLAEVRNKVTVGLRKLENLRRQFLAAQF